MSAGRKRRKRRRSGLDVDCSLLRGSVTADCGEHRRREGLSRHQHWHHRLDWTMWVSLVMLTSTDVQHRHHQLDWTISMSLVMLTSTDVQYWHHRLNWTIWTSLVMLTSLQMCSTDITDWTGPYQWVWWCLPLYRCAALTSQTGLDHTHESDDVYLYRCAVLTSQTELDHMNESGDAYLSTDVQHWHHRLDWTILMSLMMFTFTDVQHWHHRSDDPSNRGRWRWRGPRFNSLLTWFTCDLHFTMYMYIVNTIQKYELYFKLELQVYYLCICNFTCLTFSV